MAGVLILLIGPKGSGKSHIGRLLESSLGVHFFHVEPHWMAYNAECARRGREPSIPEGVRRIHPALAAALQEHRHVCVETTGASREILDDLMSFGESRGLVLASIRAPLSVCLERIRSRDPTHQIPMEENAIRRVHEMGEALDVPFDIDLENVSLSDEEILQAFARHMGPP